MTLAKFFEGEQTRKTTARRLFVFALECKIGYKEGFFSKKVANFPDYLTIRANCWISADGVYFGRAQGGAGRETFHQRGDNRGEDSTPPGKSPIKTQY